MAATPYAANNTRVHWAGSLADAGNTKDEHLEIYEGEILTAFQYNAIFRSLAPQRSVADRSNTYRIDRMSGSVVKGRKSGEALEASRVTNEKLVITVDTVLYARHPVDYQDDWTSPDWLTEVGRNDGRAFAETFDNAHIIQLQKCGDWVVPAHLKVGGAFSDGAFVSVTVKATPTLEADLEANAYALEAAHKAAVNTLVKRKIPLGSVVTLVNPDVFDALSYHPKLKDQSFSTVDGGTYAERRITRLNGIPVVESTEFPAAGTAIASYVLGSDFTLTAAQAKAEMLVFSKAETLVTVEAKGFTTDFWDDKQNFSNVLDAYAMYNVGLRRPDTCIPVRVTRSA